MYLAFWDVVFVCVENDVCEDGVCSVYVWWRWNVRESSLGVQFAFLFVNVCLFCYSLYLVRVLIVVIMGR